MPTDAIIALLILAWLSLAALVWAVLRNALDQMRKES
jgi:hypothetical protein